MVNNDYKYMKIIYVHCGPEFFSGLLSTTISVVFMAARIAYIRFFTASYLPGKKQSGTFAILHSFSDGVFYIEFYDEFYMLYIHVKMLASRLMRLRFYSHCPQNPLRQPIRQM